MGHVPQTATFDKASVRPLHGKTAIVTGSTSGIGLEIARRLAADGANVVLNGFGRQIDIARIKREIETAGGTKVLHSPADVSNAGEIRQMIAEAGTITGGVDILVNNAGIYRTSPVEATSRDDWDRVLAVNLTAPFHAIRAVLGGMKARGWGRIVNVASALGLVGASNSCAYAASKHALVGLTKAVALEAAGHGVTVNAVCPGYVATPLIEKEIEEGVRREGVTRAELVDRILKGVQPTRRFLAPDEVAALAGFLCGPGAASITGAALAADGGWTAG